MPNSNINRKVVLQGGVVNPAPIGYSINNDFTSGNWTNVSGTGTITVNANNIQFSGGTGSIGDYIYYNNMLFSSEKFTFTSTHTVGTTGGNNYGVGLSLRQQTALQSSANIDFIFYQSTLNYGKIICLTRDFVGVTVAQSLSGSALSPVPGDIITQTLVVDGNSYTLTVVQNGTNTLTYNIVLPYTYPFSTWNAATGRIAFNNWGGTNTITSWSFASNEYKNIHLALVGDSKTENYYVGANSNGITELWRANNPTKYIQKYAGVSDITATVLLRIDEIIRAKPKKVILFIGRNDEAVGILAATTQANYTSIVNQLTNGIPGVVIYHQLSLPESAGTNAPVLNAWIAATFNPAYVLPIPGTWNTGTDLVADGIHPNSTGISKLYSSQSTVISI